MKVELSTNLFQVINECAANIERRCIENDISVETHCDLCPLCGACIEVLTGDGSENR